MIGVFRHGIACKYGRRGLLKLSISLHSKGL